MKTFSVPTDFSESAMEFAILMCISESEDLQTTGMKIEVYIGSMDLKRALQVQGGINSINKVRLVKDYKDGEWLMCIYFNGELKDTVYNPPL